MSKREAAKAVKIVNKLRKLGKLSEISSILEVFKVGELASKEEKVSYAKLLVTSGSSKEALELLLPIAHELTNEFEKRLLEEAHWLSSSEVDYADFTSSAAANYIVNVVKPATLLDIGSGGGEHARYFSSKGINVTCVDLGKSYYFQKGSPEDETGIKLVIEDFSNWKTEELFEVGWASHVLEHQPNVGIFLRKLLSHIRDEGIVAITVPPLKHQIVGGHLTLWNAGLLLYNLVMAENDCSDALVMNYGYNITVIARKRKIKLPMLDYDTGDIERLQEFLPNGCFEGFDGRMLCRMFNVNS